jgi:putative ABC transport system permease protein
MIANLSNDLRYAARMLAKTPSFTLTAVLTLGLGIGANTAIFSVANALLLRPLPYKDANDLVIVTSARGPNRRPFSYLRAKFVEQRGRSFAGFAPFVSENFNMTGRGEPEQLPAVLVGWSFFDVLGVHPVLGRSFLPGDDQLGGRPVVLISDSLWKRRFGADPRAVGESIALDGVARTIIGVLPENFEFAPAGRSIDIWSSRAFQQNGLTALQINTGQGSVIAVARIQLGISLQQAQAEMQVLDAQYDQENAAMPDADPRFATSLNPFQQLMVANVRNAVLVLFGAVGLVLLIACANIASLLWSRAMARRKEIAVRIALGASRSEIVSQLLTESILLALAGGVLGVVLSLWGTRALATLPPRTLPRINPIHMDGQVLLFALALSLATGVLFGLIPTLQLSKPDVQTVLREEGRAIAGSRRRSLARGFLVVTQVALSLILLVGASLLMRSFANLQNVSLGFDPHNVLLMDITLPASRYPTAAKLAGFFDNVVGQIAPLAGVRSVAVGSALPLIPAEYSPMLPQGQPETVLAKRPTHSIQAVTPRYFESLGIALLRGRAFESRDKEGAPAVAIVNDCFVRRYWAGENPLGKRVLIGRTLLTEVVGVVADVKNIRLAVETVPELYYPLAQHPADSAHLVVRSTGDPRNLALAVRAGISAIDKEQPVTNVRTMQQHLANSIAQTRLTMLLLGILSLGALVVASVGLYGLIAYSVAQRTQELGIRLALGAKPRDILRLVMRQGLVAALLGVLAGLAGSFLLTRSMQSLLFDVSATDARTFVLCAVVFLTVAALASYVPARRAARLDPSDTLRYE